MPTTLNYHCSLRQENIMCSHRRVTGACRRCGWNPAVISARKGRLRDRMRLLRDGRVYLPILPPEVPER